MTDRFPSNPFVLIVGQDQRSRERYAACAAAADLRVEQAHNRQQALDKATTLRPDIITTELSLSNGLDGLELCRLLGDAASTKGIPILAVGGEGPTEVEEARAAGCTSVLLKPCSPERLLVEIIWILARTHRVGLIGERADHHTTVGFLTRSLWTALAQNADMTTKNADLTASAQLWADWYGRALERATHAEAELKTLRGS
jgi:two-component system cell cycle response regulator DivK